MNFRIKHFGQGGNAGGKSAAAHRDKDGVHCRQFFYNLHGDGALSGCHIQIVKRMYKCISVLFRQFQRLITGLVIDIAVKNHFRAKTLGAVHLQKRGGNRHHDGRRNSELAGGVGHTLGVVSCRCGNKTSLLFFLAQSADLIISAADFVRAGELKVFRF